eukprot:TRINITY_DN4902_c0_g1_i1.p1 TRINITY_DN4902_c0_g1~~TRINITY_DN4902_c0_g1_i1.p1  ORF type:complete len:553 (-),score=39.12 TRINITY_DN4902_c0_g1_i1:1425-3002(-)
MKSEFRIPNTTANVVKFVLIEILIAFLIEPAVAEINRIRAQRIMFSGRRVSIITAFCKRDFSGPAVGGKKGILWKTLILSALLAALLATEFSFDYTVRDISLGKRIELTALVPNSSLSAWSPTQNRGIAASLFNMVKCSNRKNGFIYETRLRPDGTCYSGNSSGFQFPEPCAVNRNENEYACVRENNAVSKRKLSNNIEHDTLNRRKSLIYPWPQNVTHVFLYPWQRNDSLYIGKKGKFGEPIVYCGVDRQLPYHFRMCIGFLGDESDALITTFGVSPENKSLLENVPANPDFYYAPVIRLGTHTIGASGCKVCATRIAAMLDLVASIMGTFQSIDSFIYPADDIGRAIALLAMGFPQPIGTAIDDQFNESVGFLIINWAFVFPFASLVLIALLISVMRFIIKSVVKIPLDYPSAMYYARMREMEGTLQRKKLSNNIYSLGLVATCEKNKVFLSMNANDTIPYAGQSFGEANVCCGQVGCKRCEQNGFTLDLDLLQDTNQPANNSNPGILQRKNSASLRTGPMRS